MTADVVGEVLRGLIAAREVLLDRLGHDDVEIASENSADVAEFGGAVFADDSCGFGDGSAFQVVGESACQQFIHDDAQRIDVATNIDVGGIAHDLLGAHVGERADELTYVGAKGRDDEVIKHGARDAKVEDLWFASFCDEDVARLEVSVDHAALMGVMNCVAERGEDREPFLRAWVLLRNELREIAAFDQFHRDERLIAAIVLRGASFVDLGDARVEQATKHFCFVLKASENAGGVEASADDFERDGAVWAVLLGAIDDAHAADSQQVFDGVGAQLRACGERWFVTVMVKARARCGELTDFLGVEERAGLRGFVDECADGFFEFCIVFAAMIDEGGARACGQVDCFREDFLGDGCARVIHHAPQHNSKGWGRHCGREHCPPSRDTATDAQRPSRF